MSIFPIPALKSEGTVHDYETGVVTDPEEIATLCAARDAEIERERLAEERIRIANETGIIKFSSGRTMDPASGIVGLSHKFEVGEGLDNLPNIVADWNADQAGEDYYAEWLRPEDLSELADIMIDRWQRFKASLEVEA